MLVGQVFALLSRESAHKLLILAGLTAEESGDLLFHKGRFSARQLTQILTEQVQCPVCKRWLMKPFCIKKEETFKPQTDVSIGLCINEVENIN